MSAWQEYGNRKGGVLRISFDNAMSRDKLVKKLISMAKAMCQEYAYIWGYEGLKRIDVKTGKLENIISCSIYTQSKLNLLGDIWASKEVTVDWHSSVIHPKSVLFPSVELRVGTVKPRECKRFVELRH